MSLSDYYRQLATLIDDLEANGAHVERADPLTESPTGEFTVELTVSLPTDIESSRTVDGPPKGSTNGRTDRSDAGENHESEGDEALEPTDAVEARDGSASKTATNGGATRGGAGTSISSPANATPTSDDGTTTSEPGGDPAGPAVDAAGSGSTRDGGDPSEGGDDAGRGGQPADSAGDVNLTEENDTGTDRSAAVKSTDDSAQKATVSTSESPGGIEGENTAGDDIAGDDAAVDTSDPDADDAESAEAADGAVDTAGGSTTEEADDEGRVPCTNPSCDRLFDSERGMKIHRTKAHLPEMGTDGRDAPAHHDPTRLREVYNQHETFAEMTTALDVDVSPQAVRRQMIRNGIHEPAAEKTNGVSKQSQSQADGPPDSEDESSTETEPDETEHGAGDDGDGDSEPSPVETPTPTASPSDAERAESAESENADGSGDEANGSNGVDDPSSDGGDDPSSDGGDATDEDELDDAEEPPVPDVDLPAELDVESVRAAVEAANTMYDVERELGLDKQAATELLSELDLLELVTGRAATVHTREKLKSEIDQRIRQSRGRNEA